MELKVLREDVGVLKYFKSYIQLKSITLTSEVLQANFDFQIIQK